MEATKCTVYRKESSIPVYTWYNTCIEFTGDFLGLKTVPNYDT
jgi:hypothetical protein